MRGLERHPYGAPYFWWLSFVDDERDEHLGCCVVKAGTNYGAVRRAHRLGINPSGQVLMLPIDGRDLAKMEADRLYSRDELKMLGYRSIREIEDETPAGEPTSD